MTGITKAASAVATPAPMAPQWGINHRLSKVLTSAAAAVLQPNIANLPWMVGTMPTIVITPLHSGTSKSGQSKRAAGWASIPPNNHNNSGAHNPITIAANSATAI